MKKVLILGFIMLASGLVSAQGQTFKTAVDFNDYIVKQQNLIGTDLTKLVEAMGRDEKSAWKAHGIVIATSETVIKNVKECNPYPGGTSLKLSALDLFGYYLKSLKNDYKRVIELLYKTGFTQADQAEMDSIVAKVTEEEAVFDAAFAKAQKEFADKYNILLE